ncbi:C6 transcription factor [Fusarium beomiforme]|uniref:C6 transcription factor n=1 Tax=Fusarium beomiforme TaxID=44412 RepID=A0A9P5A6D1_9HYPO|nr:C6 transcription factor [Fusarium beomiforme]
MGKKRNKNKGTDAASSAPPTTLSTTSAIAVDPILGYRIRVLLYDFLNVTKDPHSKKRINSTVYEHYISDPCFDESQAVMVKVATIDVDLGKHTEHADNEDFGQVAIPQHGQELETALRTFLQNFIEKRRASGDVRPCGPHYLAPLYVKFFCYRFWKISKMIGS